MRQERAHDYLLEEVEAGEVVGGVLEELESGEICQQQPHQCEDPSSSSSSLLRL